MGAVVPRRDEVVLAVGVAELGLPLALPLLVLVLLVAVLASPPIIALGRRLAAERAVLLATRDAEVANALEVERVNDAPRSASGSQGVALTPRTPAHARLLLDVGTPRPLCRLARRPRRGRPQGPRREVVGCLDVPIPEAPPLLAGAPPPSVCLG